MEDNCVQTDDDSADMKRFKKLMCSNYAPSRNANPIASQPQSHEGPPHCVRYCQEIEDLKLEFSQNKEILEEIIAKSGNGQFLWLQFSTNFVATFCK